MQLARSLVQRPSQQVQIERPVVVIEEAREAVVAALDRMLRNVGECDARKSCHDQECGDGTSVLQSVDTAPQCGVSEPDPVLAPFWASARPSCRQPSRASTIAKPRFPEKPHDSSSIAAYCNNRACCDALLAQDWCNRCEEPCQRSPRLPYFLDRKLGRRGHRDGIRAANSSSQYRQLPKRRDVHFDDAVSRSRQDVDRADDDWQLERNADAFVHDLLAHVEKRDGGYESKYDLGVHHHQCGYVQRIWS